MYGVLFLVSFSFFVSDFERLHVKIIVLYM